MSAPSLVERLSMHRTLAPVPKEEILWIASHGKLRRLDAGAILTSKDRPVDGLHIVLDGHLSIHVDRGTGRRQIMEWRGGDVTGMLPYSRIVAPPGDVVAEEPTELVTVYRSDIPDMIRECSELTAVLVHVMVDRARHFTSSYLHDEKLVSLGKLAAGLAHELNNPASAISRSANALSASVALADAAARAVGLAGLTAEQAAAVETAGNACVASGIRPVLSPLELEDRENSIADWLEIHRVEISLAEQLAQTDITFDALDRLADALNGPALCAGLQWLAARGAIASLTSEIHEASSRIYDLVRAIKGFTEMDRSAVPEPVDIEQGLANTLVVLRAKAKRKSVGVTSRIEKDVPPVFGFGGELNQVWANLIDNALDAVSDGGRVELDVAREGGAVVVRIVDDGAGISPEIRGRIFDPFFTTKPVGEGTGLGLDIVRRLIQRHHGQIELESRPGRTEFRITLPVAPAP